MTCPQPTRRPLEPGLPLGKYGGFAEAIAHLGRALELYDRVPHDDVTDPAKADLLRILAESCFAHSEQERAEQLVREALDLLTTRRTRS